MGSSGMDPARRLVTTTVKTGAYTAAANELVRCDASAGGFTVTLPAANRRGDVVVIKRQEFGGNTVTVSRAGADTVDGGTTVGLLSTAGLYLVSDGAGAWTSAVTSQSLTPLDTRYLTRSTVDAKGDIITGTADNAMARVAVGTDGQSLVADSAQASGVRWGGQVVDVFTASGTWTKRAGATSVHVIAIGPGAGGGAGRRGAAGTTRCGGGGGGSGGYQERTIPASLLTATVSVTISAGGGGAAAQTADDTNGAAGATPGVTSFGPATSASYLVGRNGNAGGGGTASTGAGGASNDSTPFGVGGATASGSGAAGGFSFGSLMVGGSSGGGITSADVTSAGGTGPSPRYQLLTEIAAGTAGGGVGGNGSNSNIYGGGQAGGGGGSSTNSAAGKGGNGGLYGAGGSGGGASLNGFNSGGGGDAAAGILIVITHF